MSKIRSYIKCFGHYLPDRVVTNDELSKLMNTSDQWIVERTGIKERRYADEGVGPSELAIPAVEMAMADANLRKEDIDLIIFATISSDYYIPGSGCLLQDKMGFPNIGAFDIKRYVYGSSVISRNFSMISGILNFNNSLMESGIEGNFLLCISSNDKS